MVDVRHLKFRVPEWLLGANYSPMKLICQPQFTHKKSVVSCSYFILVPVIGHFITMTTLNLAAMLSVDSSGISVMVNSPENNTLITNLSTSSCD